MPYNILNATQALPKVFLRQPSNEADVQAFHTALQELLSRIQPEESEEFNKNLVDEFFSRSLYRERTYMVNTYQRTDLAIFKDNRPMVLFEFKRPGSAEMVTKEDLKRKSLYELILYYIREEECNHNTEIKHLIITNCWEYFVFEKKLFYQLFVRNRRFVEKVITADTGDDKTEYIYEQIIRPEVERVEHRLQFVYVDLRSLKKRLANNEVIRNRTFLSIFKFFSPTHLLRLPFTSDHNTLNRAFYAELLYIMGVEEVTDNKVRKIKRLKNGRQPFSLVEQAYSKLEDYPKVTTEEQRFEAALGLTLTWINRILFLKLLESQLKSFNRENEVRFLDMAHISDYDVLHDLFMQVLAKPVEERSEEMHNMFPEVPYLNSSLFELSQVEQDFFPVSGIRLGDMQVYSRTVLKDGNGKRITGNLSSLDYLLRFLDAYDFSSDSSDDDTIRTESRTLINASVLGLIFEKINGYKDGSFFTPGYITEYMCRETLRNAVVDKFNKKKKWHCKDFEELKDLIDEGNREERLEANNIINSLRICDPAVGSGHFLVSALNEIIAIKSELGILQDRTEKPKRIRDYDVRVEYDELVASDEDGDVFRYNPSEPASQRIQETLFEEKRTIIENCLFGVDLNPKSVEICRLRLWIELLKNAYYYRTDDGKRHLQTLPNIDINIKCGNSLASLHPVYLGKKISEGAGRQNLVREYKRNVGEYKNCRSKALKSKLDNEIRAIKDKLLPGIQTNIFGTDYDRLSEHQSVMAHSIEWMIEFPEVLQEDGSFDGFDVVIGNPPYISLENLSHDVAVYRNMKQLGENNEQKLTYKTLESRGDIYSLFVERGLQLLHKGGRLSYIMPNKWQKVMYGRPLRQLFLDNNLSTLIDFGDNQIFDDATTYTCIIQMSNEPSSGELHISTIEKVNAETLPDDVEEQRELFDKNEMSADIWVVSSLENFHHVERLKKEMITLDEFVSGEEYYGIKTGLSEAFLIPVDKANELIQEDDCSREILRPFLQGRGLVAYGEAVASSYLVFTPKGFTALGMGIDRESQTLPVEDVAWLWFSEHYPAVARWLAPFADRARRRSDKGDYWWELRACAYYDKFAEPKLFYQVFQTKPCFIYDESSTFCNNSMYFLPVNDKRLLALLCSSVGWWLIKEFCPPIQNGRQLIWDNFRQIPIPKELPTELNDYADRLMAARENETEFVQLSAEVDEIIRKYYELLPLEE
ncbi:MAG: Eco57I restriction-modification methylase domain-containing protein [Bacteroidales bacterium]|nr:Eco57I restriction-modification methylase domain-containing protein [Bacteroidales bacterium]